jgi:2-keto-4-pentenoate hydratase/2-oxohepta-3-ene-1,7-dioic acid hydratase in catechol pathway
MRIARLQHEDGPRTAVVGDDRVAILAADVEVLGLLTAEGDARAELADRIDAERPLGDVRLLAPIEPPTFRDFSVFEAHIEGAIKTGGDPDAPVPAVWYERPYCYFSNPYAITGPGEDIRMAPGTQAQDLELEVAAVIGRAGRHLRPEDAGAHIAGYTIWNDWSARDIGGKEVRTPFGQCKGKDFANTLGPWIVTPDELEPFRDRDRYDLSLQATINGVPLNDGDTLANMAWSFEEMVAYASHGTWVRPGDVLGSGTCQNGCLLELWGRNGSLSDPPPLKPGDEVTLSVEGIGTLTNRLIEGEPVIALPVARPGRRRARSGR